MLSAAKVRMHGMQDDNWIIKDKINQYRGLIKLYERDRKIHEGDLTRQKRRYSRDIRQLRKDINVKREELGVAVMGDRQFLRNAFQEHRRLQLMYMNTSADKVLESIFQENFNKRKQLDRIRYTKKMKMAKFRSLQLETAELRDRLLYELSGKMPAEIKEQAVANYVQKANIKKNAALAIKVMYKKILDILKKDYSYFTIVLEALKLDCRAQGKCLMGATEMGQLAMEYLDDRKFEFGKLEKEIKANMKERERTLKLVRREVAYLTDSFPGLLRKEEFGNIDDLYEESEEGSQHSVHWELEEVMAICKRLQKATLVSSFDQILLRLKEQQYQSQRLTTQLTLNSTKRNALIEDRKHAILMLDTLKNVGQEKTAAYTSALERLYTAGTLRTTVPTAAVDTSTADFDADIDSVGAHVGKVDRNVPLVYKHYVAEKSNLRERLEAERREEVNLTTDLDRKGKLIIEMKTSLQQINQLLSIVGAVNVQRPKDKVPPAIQQYAVDEAIQPIPPLEDDFDKLLQGAKQKLLVLLPALQAMQPVGQETRLNARTFYHNILARAMRDNYKEDTAPEGGLIEFEMEDPNVPSHAIVKLRSKQLVDAQVSEFDVPSK